MKYYTGVGSRETPKEILDLMREYSRIMALKGWSFRSGGADGADSAFSDGWWDARHIDKEIQEGEIYLPWDGFNDFMPSDPCCILVTDKRIIQKAQEILQTVHPAYNKLTRGPLALHTRNVYQVLGADLKTPSKGLIAYAKLDKHGEPTGGTRTAIKIAEKYGVKTRNLVKDEDRKFILDFVERNR